ncbi:unnamed protein product [Strongylus vulgaris]|uniref:Uncharacterized protein n=1 Tax=Strongylus vulgaris TaxID=40348 RepID=A0A3P7J8L2_STRVU|nr:unnamed protein product [Strongylus vulgaris]
MPEGAWQEEESLEVYRKKRTQRPPADGPPEIVRFVRRRPQAGEEVYETVQPHHDGRRELILLEPVRFGDEPPATLYDDYSLYRMEEYVDAGTEICERDKQPVYYTLQKVEKEAQPTPEKEKVLEEEIIAPAREIDAITLREEEERKSLERLSSREEVRVSTTPQPTERGPYISTIPIGDVTAEERSIGRGSESGRFERPCSRCAEVSRETSRETPILDRTIYYEREMRTEEWTEFFADMTPPEKAFVHCRLFLRKISMKKNMKVLKGAPLRNIRRQLEEFHREKRG